MSYRQRLRAGLGFALGLGWVAALSAGAQGDGIYADFKTSMGSFTCRLEYAKAPLAVANFIGLAEGSKPWLDYARGSVRTNAHFYDGIVFHRVIAGFMIQGGSPNAQGTDGPGYVFPDEFDPSLRHDGAGVLSMANSGLNSNGSQFFITVSPQAGLNDVHTVFGRVVSGQAVVDAISQVATTDDHPRVDVVIQSIGIRRVGAAAAAFNTAAQPLPTVSTLRTGITRVAVDGSTNGVRLTFPRELHASHQVLATSNLVAWARISESFTVDPSATNAQEQVLGPPAAGVSRQFYSVTRTRYPSQAFVPWGVRGRGLQLDFNDGNGTMNIAFSANAPTGTYTWTQGAPGAVTGYDWQVNQSTLYRYQAYLWPIEFTSVLPMVLTFAFSNANDRAGTFTGIAVTNVNPSISGYPLSGSFLLGPAP